MRIEGRLSKLENIMQPPGETVYVCWGNPDAPGVYRLGTSVEKTDPPMTQAEVMKTIPSGTVIFVSYEQRETMCGANG